MNRTNYYLLKQVLETGYRNGLFTASVVKMLDVLLVHIPNVATPFFSKFSQRHIKNQDKNPHTLVLTCGKPSPNII